MTRRVFLYDKPEGGCRRALATLIVLAIGLAAISEASATQMPAADGVARCNEIATTDFSRTPDAPTRIKETQVVEATNTDVRYCQIKGHITPNVGVLLRLPIDNWNGKLIEIGCGGFCGSTDQIAACGEPLKKGYACITSDNGHQASHTDGSWAYNNLQAELDHAYRGAHVTALAGKAIVERYYDLPPQKSYFWGCSTGGRQALMEAQRFPWDFQGIVAGSPSLSVTHVGMTLLWANRAISNDAGEPIVTQADLNRVNAAAVAECDLNDGVKDGLIGDPRECAFDPAKLLCKTGKTTSCLTSPQVDAIRKIYSGPLTSKGEPLLIAGALPGSERGWLDWFSNLHSGSTRGTYNFVRQEFGYSAFRPNPGPDWRPEEFDFDQDYKRLGVTEGLYTANNPDLREFKAAGGKLIAYVGWNDAAGTPLDTVDYYETVERTLGGRQSTQEFFRLFAIPGMNHCAGGEGASVVDYLSYLETWVEKGQAPTQLVGSHLKAPASGNIQPLGFPPDPALVEFSRPVYPYPVKTMYLGRGDTRNAANFGPDRRDIIQASSFGEKPPQLTSRLSETGH